jgi:hypothetical protein
MSEAVFVCKRCGHCCDGSGGIILTAKDLTRLADHLGMREAECSTKFAEEKSGRLRLRAENGRCIFYEEGCGVHPGRPDVCRAWPFFRGNLLDEDSRAMASVDCTGINMEASFEDFRAAGLHYVAALNVDEKDCPHALNMVGISAKTK